MELPVGPTAVPAGSVAVAVALGLDVAVGEPPRRAHPVALFGRLVEPVDAAWDHPRLVGVGAAALLPVAFAAALGATAALALALSPLVGVLVSGACLFVTLSLRMLLAVGRDVVALSATDPSRARGEIRALVGRDADDLTPDQLRSGVVESLAENLADGLVAPLLGFVLGATVSLPVAVAAAAWVKGVNTLDSMLGYESKPIGWAAARLDDAVMWLPARASGLLIALAARDPGALVRARRWAGEPRSPNSGWPMATLAAALDVSLWKPGGYTLNPEAGFPTTERAERGVRIVALAGVLSGATAVVLAGVVPSASTLWRGVFGAGTVSALTPLWATSGTELPGITDGNEVPTWANGRDEVAVRREVHRAC